ncbi:unnamed product [Ostreococcus tauri]|uniref:Unnamed product n=1 Tax=Ostreococcus tauri TaxID=70448 RepID=A0A096PAS6_OSTTA|nr:unnamed product [Ostreococcus tauri]CEG02020.1 unnamed product [Ostreococcus tauri]|eukprot:XP_022841307.1 unnamed product [Ostreococcus tauri]
MATEGGGASRTTTPTAEGASAAGGSEDGATGEGWARWRWARRMVMGLASAIVALYVVGVTASVGEDGDGPRSTAGGDGGVGVETARVAAPTSARVAYVPQPGAKGARYRDR